MISIIVPIYNVEKYLEPCIESILASTYRDFELILVDDGSTDGSSEISKRYAKQDSRVKFIHKDNGGVSSARNEGIKNSTGDYVMFIDGDDMIHPQMLEVLYEAILCGDYDLAMAKSVKVYESDILGRRRSIKFFTRWIHH